VKTKLMVIVQVIWIYIGLRWLIHDALWIWAMVR